MSGKQPKPRLKDVPKWVTTIPAQFEDKPKAHRVVVTGQEAQQRIQSIMQLIDKPEDKENEID